LGKDFGDFVFRFRFRRKNYLGLVLENLCFDEVLAGEDGGERVNRERDGRVDREKEMKNE
jgi:cell division protein FtsI/penicillin-binding protein 2